MRFWKCTFYFCYTFSQRFIMLLVLFFHPRYRTFCLLLSWLVLNTHLTRIHDNAWKVFQYGVFSDPCSLYLDWIQKNRDQKISVFGHFSRSAMDSYSIDKPINFDSKWHVFDRNTWFTFCHVFRMSVTYKIG